MKKYAIFYIASTLLLCSCNHNYYFKADNHSQKIECKDIDVGIWSFTDYMPYPNNEETEPLIKMVLSVKYITCQNDVRSNIASSDLIVGFTDKNDIDYVFGVYETGNIYLQTFYNYEVKANYVSAANINYNKFHKIFEDSEELSKCLEKQQNPRHVITYLYGTV